MPDETDKPQVPKKIQPKRRSLSAKPEAGAEAGQVVDVAETPSEEESGGSETAAPTETETQTEPPTPSEKAAKEDTATKETQELIKKPEEPKPRSLAQILRFKRKVVKRRR
jgi:hypothetical protein